MQTLVLIFFILFLRFFNYLHYIICKYIYHSIVECVLQQKVSSTTLGVLQVIQQHCRGDGSCIKDVIGWANRVLKCWRLADE